MEDSNSLIYRIFHKYEGFLLAIAIISAMHLNSENQCNTFLAEVEELDGKIETNTYGQNLDGIIYYSLNQFEDIPKLRFLFICIFKEDIISTKTISSIWQCDLEDAVSQLREFQRISFIKDMNEHRY